MVRPLQGALPPRHTHTESRVGMGKGRHGEGSAWGRVGMGKGGHGLGLNSPPPHSVSTPAEISCENAASCVVACVANMC